LLQGSFKHAINLSGGKIAASRTTYALHKFAPRSAHRADDNFLVLEGGCEGRIRLFYKNSEQKRLEVGALGREVCYAAIQGAV
jgi:hypothetical protein